MSDDQNNYKKNTESAIIKMEVKFVQMIMCKEQLKNTFKITISKFP